MRCQFLILALIAVAILAAPLHALGQDTWSEGAALPNARSEIAVATLHGRIYVAGGLRQLGATKLFARYDPKQDRWERLADLPQALHHLAMAGADGRVYIAGGYSGSDFTPDNAAVWAYDPETDAWSPRRSLPWPRAAHAMVALGDELYVVGGVGPASEVLWIYNPARDEWRAVDEPLPTKREHLTAVAHDGRLYVIGGRWRGEGNTGRLEIYDPATGTWSRGPDMPTPRGGLTAAAVGNHLHVTGGEAFSPGRTFGQHEVYDPATNSWTTGAALPTPRHGLGSAAVDGQWYVIGGGEEAGWRTPFTLSDRVEIFTPDSAN